MFVGDEITLHAETDENGAFEFPVAFRHRTVTSICCKFEVPATKLTE
jgi:hypothetical protein